MARLKKMLENADSPYIVSLMRLIETQSKDTLVRWCVGYAQKHILPIYENAYPDDFRPREALNSAIGWLDGSVKFAAAKESIFAAHEAATEAEGNPAAQAAARAAFQSAVAIHVPAHCLGLALYGAVAITYARAGINETWDVYERIAAEECAKMEAALRSMAVTNETNPAKLGWKLWRFKTNIKY